VAIVWPCPLSVDAYVAAGRKVEFPRPGCPSCAGRMVFWSGYRRQCAGVRPLPEDLCAAAALRRLRGPPRWTPSPARSRPQGTGQQPAQHPFLLAVPGTPARKPADEDALAQRLHALGISPRQSRSTALFTLAADVPAAILAKTLGIHVKAAIQWQKISGGDWSGYAADISRRGQAQEQTPARDQHADPLPSA